MLLHRISVHIFMPAGIDTPGFVAENARKPELTKKIEQGDKVIGPEACAGHLIRGAPFTLRSAGAVADVVTGSGIRRAGTGILPTDGLLRDRFDADAVEGGGAGEQRAAGHAVLGGRRGEWTLHGRVAPFTATSMARWVDG